MSENVFDTLNNLDVGDYIEEKDTGKVKLKYLSWPWAWAQIKKRYPAASYEILRDPLTNLPYSYDPNTGYMCYTSVTIEGITHTMWLPVMDSNNRAMKSEPYTVKTKYNEINVSPATMFDINKTIMRCLVKNLAMFGLGLYIYAGEDLPESAYDSEPEPAQKKEEQKPEKKPYNPDPLILRCQKCGAVIEPYVGKDGKKVSVEKHAAGCKEKFAGKILCLKCINEYMGGRKNDE